jgi:hypothetical protein
MVFPAHFEIQILTTVYSATDLLTGYIDLPGIVKTLLFPRR